MTGLDLFALLILIVLALSAVGVWVLIGMMPGRIARQRNHPQADAIAVCGWWGVITMGLLAPIAWIWAYTNPDRTLAGDAKPGPQRQGDAEEGDQA